MATSAETATIEAVWRIEAPRLIARLSRLTNDVGLAEDLAQDAFVAALEQWPGEGVPKSPAAWLLTAARRRAIDIFRRNSRLRDKYAVLGRQLQAEEEASAPDIEERLDTEIEDDLLRLVFTACHPIVSPEARVALTLRLLGGLTVPEIARAFLVPEATIAQRVVRAKKTLAAKKVPFEVPSRDELADRLGSVLEVIYLIYNEGYAASAGDDWMRPELAREGVRLARVLAELLPREPEVHGLAALLELQSSRSRARTSPDGEPVLLLEQDRSKWDWLLVGRGMAALDRAQRLGATAGFYVLQAEIAACHASARRADDTDWERIAALYDDLMAIAPSPVVALNRAVAVDMARGPEDGLAAVDEIASDPVLRDYPLLPGVRGDLLFKLGRFGEARSEFERAAAMTENAAQRSVLLRRAEEARRAGR